MRGSAFDDELADFGRGSLVKLDGNEGNDVLRSGLENHTTTFDMNAAADGADKVIAASPVFAFVDYSQRTRPVTVTLDHAGAADGEAGEGDEITGNLTRVLGGQAGDTITRQAGPRTASPSRAARAATGSRAPTAPTSWTAPPAPTR